MSGQTHPTFHPTLAFSMLDEMLDAFYQGFSIKNLFHLDETYVLIALVAKLIFDCCY